MQDELNGSTGRRGEDYAEVRTQDGLTETPGFSHSLQAVNEALDNLDSLDSTKPEADDKPNPVENLHNTYANEIGLTLLNLHADEMAKTGRNGFSRLQSAVKRDRREPLTRLEAAFNTLAGFEPKNLSTSEAANWEAAMHRVYNRLNAELEGRIVTPLSKIKPENLPKVLQLNFAYALGRGGAEIRGQKNAA